MKEIEKFSIGKRIGYIVLLLIIGVLLLWNWRINYKIKDIKNTMYENTPILYYLKSQNKSIIVPSDSIYYKEGGQTAICFRSPKKIEVLEEEINSILASDEFKKFESTNGKTEYVNENQNYKISDYSVTEGIILNEFCYTFSDI